MEDPTKQDRGSQSKKARNTEHFAYVNFLRILHFPGISTATIGIQTASMGIQTVSIGIRTVLIGFLWMSVFTQNSKLTQMKYQLTRTKCQILRK